MRVTNGSYISHQGCMCVANGSYILHTKGVMYFSHWCFLIW
jgi:hypothetical protein